MIIPNKERLAKAARELRKAAEMRTAQDATLAILRAQEIVQIVLTDLALRPEVNTDKKAVR